MKTENPLTNIGNGTTTAQTAAAPVFEPNLFGNIGSALGITLFVILVIAWLVKRFGFGLKSTKTPMLTVRDSCVIGTKERVVVVEVKETLLVLGVSSTQVNLLHTFPCDPNDIEQAAAVKAETNKFSAVLQQVLKGQQPK